MTDSATWRYNLRLIVLCMLVGFSVTFVLPFFAHDGLIALHATRVGVAKWAMWRNLPFYLGAQGAVIIYVVLVVFYAMLMNRRDRQWRQAQAKLTQVVAPSAPVASSLPTPHD